MIYIEIIKVIWPMLAAIIGFMIHIEIKLARMETNIQWLIECNSKKGGDEE